MRKLRGFTLMEMLVAISIGALVMVGCAAAIITFTNIWSKEGKQDLLRDTEYNVNKTLTSEMIKAIFECVNDMDFQPLPNSNNKENSYLHWRSYDEPASFAQNAKGAISIDYWLVFEEDKKTLSIWYQPDYNSSSGTKNSSGNGISEDNKVQLFTNCNGLEYQYFTPGTGSGNDTWESQSTPKEITENNVRKWIIPDTILISIDKTKIQPSTPPNNT
jgi:prepilin-type N-terminal cleavage/methylation domain-containing protein